MREEKKDQLTLLKTLENVKRENNEKFRLLSDLTNEMIVFQDIDSIYKKIVSSLEKLYPDSVILYVSIDEKEMETRLETIAGIDNSLLKKVLSISGFNPVGRKYKLTSIHRDYFRSGDFIEFEGGLSDFVANEFSPMAARAIERLIGLYKIYTIGIKKDDKLLGAIHFFTFNNNEIDDSSFIEFLVRQTGIILEKKLAEDALSDISSGLSVLNEATMGFTESQTVSVFYADIVHKLKSLTGGTTVTLSIFNPTEKNLYVNYADIEPGVFNGLIQVLGGKRIYEISFPVSDEWYKQLSKKPINYYKTLHEATFGVVPKMAGSVLQKIQGIDRFLGIAYFLDKELYGTSLVALRSNVPDPPEDLVNSYAHMVALGLSRTRTEIQLQQNEEKYRNIFENVQDVYYEATLEGIILEVSPSVEILSDGLYTRKDLIGKSINEFYVNIEERNTLISALLEHGRVTDFEVSFKVHDNRIIPCSIASKLGYDSQGRPEKIIGSMHNISERKCSENALRKSEQNLQTLFNTIAEGVALNEVVYDQNEEMTDYRILQVNKSFYTVTGATPSQVIGNLASVLYSMPHNMIRTFWLEHRNNHSTITSEIKSPIGDRWFFVSTSPIVDDKFVTTFTDITERKLAEIELMNAKAKAEESDRLKTAFLATMNHELRTPLNLILGFSELIKSGVASDECIKFATIINDSGQNLHSMIEEVFDLALIEHENIKLRLQTFSLIDHFIENKSSLDELLIFSGKNDQIRLLFKPDIKKLSGFVTTDRSKINQVLTALFKNAVKFTNKGTIEFGYLLEDKSTLTFYVKDSGIGIIKEKQNIIFELFRKGEDSNSNGYGGIGIGLTIAQKITKILKGNLTVESTIGTGSKFSLTIPVEIS